MVIKKNLKISGGNWNPVEYAALTGGRVIKKYLVRIKNTLYNKLQNTIEGILSFLFILYGFAKIP